MSRLRGEQKLSPVSLGRLPVKSEGGLLVKRAGGLLVKRAGGKHKHVIERPERQRESHAVA